MKKFERVLLIGLWLAPLASFAQHRPEGAHRIRKAQFPEVAHEVLQPWLTEARGSRYYRETDQNQERYAICFRKDRLDYRVDFDAAGRLEQAGLRVNPVDLPQDAWGHIQTWLKERFKSSRVRTIWQAYPRKAFAADADTFRNAFQNLLVSELQYEIVVKARTPDNRGTFMVLFDSQGNFRKLSEVAPPNHEHVLY
jgi:hypothetical protein